MDILSDIKGNEIYKNMFERSVVGMSITSLDGRLNANAAFCKMTGSSKEGLLDRKWAEVESGSGLVSMICKELAEKPEKMIWAENEEENGSTFHVTQKQIE
ncbi:MAG: PAS domain S-box protein [Bacteroidetes bacterium]|nr:PAS domain S-box protein [Bacteroidota bacterium]MCL6101922.1 PAS domain S-box protein [Bacteroidota bacterium]